MDLPSSKVIEILAAKGVTEIHHANSVLTSTQYLRNASLLSRGTIKRRGMFQTAQRSDKGDHDFSLWFDIFADSVDIHARARTANVYGPVLFVLGLEEVKAMYKGRLWVTKLNPTEWEGTKREQKWFRSLSELKAGLKVGTFAHMIVFRHSGGELPIRPCLRRIILDDPHQRYTSAGVDSDVFSMAYGALLISMTEGRINVPIAKRTCSVGCKCQDKYRNKGILRKMFLPSPASVP